MEGAEGGPWFTHTRESLTPGRIQCSHRCRVHQPAGVHGDRSRVGRDVGPDVRAARVGDVSERNRKIVLDAVPCRNLDAPIHHALVHVRTHGQDLTRHRARVGEVLDIRGDKCRHRVPTRRDVIDQVVGVADARVGGARDEIDNGIHDVRLSKPKDRRDHRVTVARVLGIEPLGQGVPGLVERPVSPAEGDAARRKREQGVRDRTDRIAGVRTRSRHQRGTNAPKQMARSHQNAPILKGALSAMNTLADVATSV